MKAAALTRSLKLAAAAALAAWLTGSFAQQDTPPAQPPADRPAPATPPPAPPPPPQQDEDETPRAPPGEEPDDVFVPTEELQPDAAVTFPVDI